MVRPVFVAAADSTCPANLTIKDGDLEDKAGGVYKGPAARSGACTATEMTRFEQNVSSLGSNTWDDLIVGLSSACGACILTRSDGPNWGPIVRKASEPEKAILNFGACLAALNGSVACGRAFQYRQYCTVENCERCAPDAGPTCANAVLEPGGLCRSWLDSTKSACPDLVASEQTCGPSIVQHVQVLCGPL